MNGTGHDEKANTPKRALNLSNGRALKSPFLSSRGQKGWQW